MSSFVENAVARYGMLVEAVAEPDVLDEVGRVREARLAGPVVEDLQPATSPGTKWTRSPPRSAWGCPPRS